jgi:hypothetical protein
MATKEDDKKMATEAQPQAPAPTPPAKKKSDLPDKIPDFPGDSSSGSPG